MEAPPLERLESPRTFLSRNVILEGRAANVRPFWVMEAFRHVPGLACRAG